MNAKLNKILIFLTVLLTVFAIASVAAVMIVESRIQSVEHHKFENPATETEDDRQTSEKENDGFSDEQSEQGERVTEAASTYELELEGGAKVEHAKNTDDKTKKRLTPSEVIESIPFSEKISILKKYMPKMSANDFKLFMSLLSAEKPDFKAAEKRLYEIYSVDEIKVLYNIYKSYEEKLYESKS